MQENRYILQMESHPFWEMFDVEAFPEKKEVIMREITLNPILKTMPSGDGYLTISMDGVNIKKDDLRDISYLREELIQKIEPIWLWLFGEDDDGDCLFGESQKALS